MKPTPRRRTELSVEGKTLAVSNLEKVLYPQTGFTKGEVLKYYVEISPILLPHLKKRPITLKRYPDGVEGLFFYEKNCPSHRPEWIHTAKVPRRQKQEPINYCVLEDLSSLIWAVNLADLELHTFLHREPTFEQPFCIAFDLDPGPGANILLCGKVALWVKEIFDTLGLQSFPKTSGSKGLQVFVPLNTPASYDQTKTLAKAIAESLEKDHPETVVSNMQKARRQGKVLIDWSQNDSHKTTVSAYSLRAKDRPTVSTPLQWKEIEKATDPVALEFECHQVLERVKRLGDLFEPVLHLKQKLPTFSV